MTSNKGLRPDSQCHRRLDILSPQRTGTPIGSLRSPSSRAARRSVPQAQSTATDPPDEALPDDAVDRRGQDAWLDVHVLQALDRRRRRLRVERRQDEVPGHGGAEGYLCRLLVADLADQDHVGVRAEDGAQPACEVEPRPRVDLDLVEAFGAVLDRVLDRGELTIRRVEHLHAGEERRRLAGARRPYGDDGAERLGDGQREVARPRGDIPRSLSDDGASPCERILSVIFSPYADGSTAIGHRATLRPAGSRRARPGACVVRRCRDRP